jgi:hypothetical protein
MWEAVNRGLDEFFGIVFYPLTGIDPVWQGVILGLPVALLALLIYKLASNQQGITRSKDLIKGHLLELLLFRDDLRVILGAQGRALWQCLVYLRHALLPLAILIVPVALLLVQIETRYANRALLAGESALVSIVLAGDRVPTSFSPGPGLTGGQGLDIESPALRLDAERRLVWRVRAVEPGKHRVMVRLDGMDVSRQIAVGPPETGRVVKSIYRNVDLRTLGSPGEAALAEDSPAESIYVGYPERSRMFAGLSYVTWALIGASLLFGFVLRRPFRVDF